MVNNTSRAVFCRFFYLGYLLLFGFIPFSGCATSGVVGMEASQLERTTDRQTVGLIAAARAAEHLSRQEDAKAGEWLVEAWARRDTFIDDRGLRDMVSLLTHLPEPLVGQRTLEDAAAAAGGGVLRRARDLIGPLTEVGDDPSGDALFKGRLSVLRASLAPREDDEQSLLMLRAMTRMPLEGALGSALKARAMLLTAGLHHRAGRHKEAMAAYLKVSQSSGLWRQARVGLAWCQLRVSNPKRSIAILALLPGGIVADAERALISAMAAGALGMLEHARSVIAEAQKFHRQHWVAPGDAAQQLLELALSPGESVRLKQPDEGLLLSIASRPSIRILAAEIRRVRALPEALRPSLVAYERVLEVTWNELVERTLAAESQRVEGFLFALEEFEAQLPASP